MKQIFLALSMLSSLSFGMQITRAGQDYSVFDGTQSHTVKPYMVDPLLKRMDPEQLQRFVEQGNRIKAIKLSDGDYRLQANVPGLGGGPVLAVIATTGVAVGGGVGLFFAGVGAFFVGGPLATSAVLTAGVPALGAAIKHTAIATITAPTL